MPVSTDAIAGPSSTLTSGDPTYNNDQSSSLSNNSKLEVHDVFKFSAKLHFAEAICKIEPIPLSRVQLLLDSCPIPSEDTLKFEKADYYHAVSLLLVSFLT